MWRAALNPRLVVYAAVLIFAAQNLGTESLHDELVRLQEQQGVTLAWTDSQSLSQEFSNLPGDESPFQGVLFRKRIVIPIKDSAPPIRPLGFSMNEVPGPKFLEHCWSHDRIKVAFMRMTKRNVKFGIFDRQSRETETFDSPDAISDMTANLNSQCWSPDDENIAYAVEGHVKVHSVGGGSQGSHLIAEGSGATWTPDGQWISFLDHGTYYAVHPDGTSKRKLFRNHWGRAVSALYWSPDSRIVAYVRELGFLQGGTLDVEDNQLRVRRLEDGSEDRLCDYVDWYADYQWVTSPDLIEKPKSK